MLRRAMSPQRPMHALQLTTGYLAEAYIVTIFGYSAPSTDIEARSLLLKAWKENSTRTLAQFYIVDIKNKDEVRAAWADFTVRDHVGVRQQFADDYLMMYPRRSCEAFAFATLQQDPWHEDPFPRAKSLAELEDWVKPLLVEEEAGKFGGKPLH